MLGILNYHHFNTVPFKQARQYFLLICKIFFPQVVKVCSSMVEAGKTYVAQQSLFANSLWELSVCFRTDHDTTSYLNKLIHALQEMNKYLTILLDQASRTILMNLNSFLKE